MNFPSSKLGPETYLIVIIVRELVRLHHLTPLVLSHMNLTFFGKNLSASDWHLLSDTREKWSRGRWVNGSQEIEYDLDFPCSHPIVGVCRRYERYKRTIKEYKWSVSPKEHDSTAINGSSFSPTYSIDLLCRTLGGKNLFFVGDSLTEHWWVYFALIATKSQNIVQSCMNNEENYHYVRIDCASYGIVKLHYIRHDPLWVTNETSHDIYDTSGVMKGAMRHIYSNRDWINAVYNESNTVLVLNRGAHYAPDTELLQDIGHLFTYVTSRYPNISIVWRNTPAGHPHCTPFDPPFDAPLTVPPDLTLDRGNIPDNSSIGSTHRYHWNLFAHQNQLVKTFLAQHFPSTLYLDAATPTNLRPDHHVSDTDCLHYCPHGVHDFWVLLLLNAFDYVINVTEGSIHSQRSAVVKTKIPLFSNMTMLNATCPQKDLMQLRRPPVVISQPPSPFPSQSQSQPPSLSPSQPLQKKAVGDDYFLLRSVYVFFLCFLFVVICRQSSYFLLLYFYNRCFRNHH